MATVALADDHANACTEADNPTSFATCQLLRDQCASIISGCDILSGTLKDTCISTIASTFDTFANGFDLSGVTDCDCAAFTCDENFSDSGSGSGAVGLVASLGMVLMMKIFA